MKPIKVLFTGGTIGTIENDAKQIELLNSEDFLLLSLYKKKYPQFKWQYDAAQPVNYLSEHISFQHLNSLLSYLKKMPWNNYSGLIITHGTDTLAYVANILAIVLHGISIPVVFVGSNQNLSDPDTDALLNLHTAFSFIHQVQSQGVFVSFTLNGKPTIFAANRVLQSMAFSDEFRQIDEKAVASFDGEKFTVFQKEALKHQISEKNKDLLLYRLKDISTNLLLIKAAPFLCYQDFKLDHTQAILQELYHSATLDTTQEWMSFANSAKEKNIPFYVAPLSKRFLEPRYSYPSMDLMKQFNIHFLPSVSMEFAFAKIIIAHSLYQNEKNRLDFIHRPIGFERIENHE